MLVGASILVTGGTGTFGKAFVRALLEHPGAASRIVVFSRDELKQYEMSLELAEHADRLRFFLGDVRDAARLRRALEGVEYVVHAAALKQVQAAEYNPFEAIKTNVIGAQNVIEASLDSQVRRVVALSTDKAAAPVNLYGATKLCSDKLFIAANNFRGKRDIRFGVVRYGNVLGSRGSLVPLFLSMRHQGFLPITHPEMTRFSISVPTCVNMVTDALSSMHGGETFVPKIPSFRVVDMAEALAPSVTTKIVGIRPGEKIHEDLITDSDATNSYDLGERFVIADRSSPAGVALAEAKTKRCPEGFRYNSGANKEWLSVDQLRDLVRRHVDSSFAPL